MLATQEVHLVHSMVADMHTFFKTGCPGPDLGSPGLQDNTFGE